MPSDRPRVLVVAPHPDDDVLGCGASLAKLADEGSDVFLVTVIAREDPAPVKGRVIPSADEEIQAACKVLGVTDFAYLQEESRGFQATRDVRIRLIRLIRRWQPDIMYSPQSDDHDPEHRAVGEVAREALWMAQSGFFPEAGPRLDKTPRYSLGYEVWSPMRRHQYVEDVGGFVERKVEAIECYRSQREHVQWPSLIRGLAAYRGAGSSASGHAEVFEVFAMNVPAR